jgi:hypothetical protein
MKAVMSCVLAVALLGGCGVEEVIKRNDDRYMRPGALDMPLTGIYRTYQFNLLERYRVTQQWVSSSGCRYGGVEKPDIRPGVRSFFFVGTEIFEENGKTWIRSDGIHKYDFDRFVRSVKEISKERGREGTVIEIGWRPVCFESWWVTSHYLRAMLYKRDLASWRAKLTEENPKGKWSERRVGDNLWLVQETAEDDMRPRPLNGVGGPFQFWLLPIADTGYTLGMELGASRESLQYPDAHARFQATFRHLIESVKIEPLRP